MMSPRSPAFESYLAPARTQPGAWRAVVGTGLILLCWILGMIAILTSWVLARIFDDGDIDAGLGSMDALVEGGDPFAIAILLLSFVGIWVGVFTALAWLHRQPAGTIFAPRASGALRDFGKGVAFALLIFVPGALIGSQISETTPGLAWERWIWWVLPITALVFIQATAEELIFRGYLLQQIATRVRAWPVWALLPSLLFGLLHYGDRSDGADLYYVAVTTVMGLMLCVLVWRSGSLMPAIGVHVANNVLALTVIGPGGALGGTQLFLFAEDSFTTLIQLDLALSLLALLVVLSPLGRVFDRAPEDAALH